jgi:hypothetical protein
MSMIGKLSKYARTVAASVTLVIAALALTTTPAHATSNMVVGLTLDPADYTNELPKWTDQQPTIGRAEIMRVFWSSAQGCPTWTDSRIQKLKSESVIPFISFKVYDTNCLKTLLDTMPSDIPIAYFTYFHEPEQDMDAATFKSRSQAMWNVFKAHPRYAVEHRVVYMTIQTKQWTFIHNGGNYSTYWCGCGNYFGVDMYANSWDAAYPDPSTFVNTETTFGVNHGINVFFPEVGAARKSTDSSGSGRAAFITTLGNVAHANSKISGMLWWNDLGTGGVDFRLDPAHVGTTQPDTSPESSAWRTILNNN